MVKVSIVEEKDQDQNSPYSSHASSRTGSSDSLSSVSSVDDTEDETLLERISALVDIVPPSTRLAIHTHFNTTVNAVKKTGKFFGNAVWIVTTSALLIGLPFAVAMEEESRIVAAEKEMMEQQQGAQAVSSHHLFPTKP
ncbi:mitochondrial import translocase, subunit Tom22 [Fistulina hepatica ATCC 64428]|uniref:Mitochondrial import translocase, subunit Tom22 n=1 Tax=Fistulina hepatica ATCC 64428 TaxID=1128425 RepID=A0A0D7AM17_9AGAR|nr:mitochondrial import translocase, subunit Tom22 [Fistulina hepatica ATCC 64428]